MAYVNIPRQYEYVYADDDGVFRGSMTEQMETWGPNATKKILYKQYNRDGSFLGWGEGDWSLQHFGPCGRYTQHGNPATQPLTSQTLRSWDSGISMGIPEPMETYGQASRPTHTELPREPNFASQMMRSWDSEISMGIPAPIETYGQFSRPTHTELPWEPDLTSFDDILKDVLPLQPIVMADYPQQTTQPAFQSEMMESAQHPNISPDDHRVISHDQQPMESLGHYPQPASNSVDANTQAFLNWLERLQAELRAGTLPSNAVGLLHMRLQTVHTEFMNSSEEPTHSRKRASEEAVDPKPTKRRARTSLVSKVVSGSSEEPLPAAARLEPTQLVPLNDDDSGFEAYFDFSDASDPVMGSQSKKVEGLNVGAELEAELFGSSSDPVSLEPMPEEHVGTETRPTSDSV